MYVCMYVSWTSSFVASNSVQRHAAQDVWHMCHRLARSFLKASCHWQTFVGTGNAQQELSSSETCAGLALVLCLILMEKLQRSCEKDLSRLHAHVLVVRGDLNPVLT